MAKYHIFSIYGIGGIGKTSLAIEYINRFSYMYNHVAYVKYQDNIKNSLIKTFKVKITYHTKDDEEKLIEIQKFLLSLNHDNNLIILDNIQTDDELKFLKEFIPNFKILITTRINFNKIKSLYLGTLDYVNSKKLFLEFYKTNENIDNILDHLDYHTLFIELTAKTLNYSNVLKISDLENKFKSGEFQTIHDNYEDMSFHSYLNELFELNNLTKEEIFILNKISIFSPLEISFEEFVVLFKVSKEELSDFDLKISHLVKAGWLIKKNGKFKLHQIIKEFLFANYKISFEDIKYILVNLSELLTIKNYYKLNHNDIVYNYLPFAILVFEYFGMINKYLVRLLTNIIFLLDHMGSFNDSLKYYRLIINKIEELEIDDNLIIFQYYNNLSVLYMHKQENNKARNTALKAIEILDNLNNNNKSINLEYSKIYNNLALIYMNKFEYFDAYSTIKKSISLEEKIKDINTIESSIRYSNLGLICYELYMRSRNYAYIEEGLYNEKKALFIQKDLLPNTQILSATYTNLALLYLAANENEKAFKHQLIALNILEHYYKFLTYEIAKSYCNLGLIYNNLGELDISLNFHKIGLEKRLECLDFPHPEIALSYHEISYVYKHKEKYDEAIKTHLESQKIYSLIYGEEYDDIYDSYLFLATTYAKKINSSKIAISYFDKSLNAYKKNKFFRMEMLITLELEKANYLLTIGEIKLLKKTIINIEKEIFKVSNISFELFIEFNRIKNLSN